jgi:hypothetical protein
MPCSSGLACGRRRRRRASLSAGLADEASPSRGRLEAAAARRRSGSGRHPPPPAAPRAPRARRPSPCTPAQSCAPAASSSQWFDRGPGEASSGRAARPKLLGGPGAPAGSAAGACALRSAAACRSAALLPALPPAHHGGGLWALELLQQLLQRQRDVALVLDALVHVRQDLQDLLLGARVRRLELADHRGQQLGEHLRRRASRRAGGAAVRVARCRLAQGWRGSPDPQ